MSENAQSLSRSDRESTLHPALAILLDELGREDGHIDSGPHWIEFLSADAYIDATIKQGDARVRIRAYPLGEERGDVTDGEVLSWVEKQPRPSSGVVQAFVEVQEDETENVIPRLVFERPVNGFTTDFIEEDIFRFANAWETRSVAEPQPDVSFDRGDPAELLPQNAWLLMGDSASFCSAQDLAQMEAEGGVGVYDTLWTGPKNGELGDLALMYFVAPQKAACFVARFASRPFSSDEFIVNAETVVENHQWWVYTSPLIEIEPIPFTVLRNAQNGFLLLKGQSGKYLHPDTIAALAFKAADPAQQEELDRIVQKPAGHTKLPDRTTMTFEDWRRIPSGLLSLEAKVSDYIVRPLGELVYGPDWEWTRGTDENRIEPTVGPLVTPEYRVRSGFVDFVFSYPTSTPALAVEVKLSILRPASGVWSDSPDFRQLRRYMDDLGTPGLLVDAQRLLLVRQGADTPFAEIVRADATWDDIALIRDLISGPSGHEAHERDIATKRYVIVLGPHPMMYSSTATSDVTHDQCVVVADSFDSPIQRVENIGNQDGYDLIKSSFDDAVSLTPRQAVGIFGASGMYRLDGGSEAPEIIAPDVIRGPRIRASGRRTLRRG